MNLLPNISKTILHSFIFALGGTPTLAMWLSERQTQQPEQFMAYFVSLTVLIACIIFPVVFIQNSFLLWKRLDPNIDNKITKLSYFYLILNIICMIYWITKVWLMR
ncbi:hypothetical protein [Acinetobacter larvae]|uniref:DUF1705 domain-containing protein n=1 Tax=Acinetobacter larvae TaxID=1789224 RepID=A0A1B2M489_9GAMM|nr:hypothetical protein [Acinetobacter larvae]AOA59984.1 hypothetical protein BFG52_11705 [Acinetobacter larvae]